MNKLNILYEDNHIIVVVKAANILSQADDTKDIDMLTIIKNYLKEKYQKPGNVYLGLVHRLDRPVSGVMVFAKTSKAASRLSEQVRNHEFKKKYLAVITGILSNTTGTFTDYLIKEEDGTTKVTNKNQGKLAVLNYTVKNVNKEKNLSLVDIDLETGRHHQIRVQFASRGYPLYGDQRYGQQDKLPIALHAYEISFTHPTIKEVMTFKSLPPKVGVWKYFE
ncbi:MAG: RluA family pseudouridine synthase [Bacilli bacterium]